MLSDALYCTHKLDRMHFEQQRIVMLCAPNCRRQSIEKRQHTTTATTAQSTTSVTVKHHQYQKRAYAHINVSTKSRPNQTQNYSLLSMMNIWLNMFPGWGHMMLTVQSAKPNNINKMRMCSSAVSPYLSCHKQMLQYVFLGDWTYLGKNLKLEAL